MAQHRTNSRLEPDRRLVWNRPLSVAVDAGIACHERSGEDAAKRIFLTHHVPSTVAARVLFHADERRASSKRVEDKSD